MVRFSNGTPQAMWFSQHASGQAFTYNAVQKEGKRPYTYSANGTHANYAVAGYGSLPPTSLEAAHVCIY